MNDHHVALGDVLDNLTRPGTLYERLPDKAVRCVACAHRCLIREGKRGICQVRFNREGVLLAPYGYAAGIHADPIEKKPFFHVLPGSDALTFGMLGCDMHCSYCFTGDTMVITESGPVSIDQVYASCTTFEQTHDGAIGYPVDLRAITSAGCLRPVRAVFRHSYRGDLSLIRPYYLPALRCTPDHRIYATDSVAEEPALVPASRLTTKHYLAIPRHYAFSSAQTIDVTGEIGGCEITYRVPWKHSRQEFELLDQATKQGKTSREIASMLGTSASNIRHLRRRVTRRTTGEARTRGPIIEADRLRFPNERRPGIPLTISLDENMARLLGLYCAEGSVVSAQNRPNSHTMNLSFSPAEVTLVREVKGLVQDKLGVRASLVHRPTTLAVTSSKASVALLLRSLAGGQSQEKRVPRHLFDAPRPVVEAFLNAYVEGDGHRYANGKVTVTTVSRELAYGIAWLALKLGYFASIYDTARPEQGMIQGRPITLSPHQYSVVWYENSAVKRRLIETEAYYLVPIRTVDTVAYEGDVYNMEVDDEHDYLAGLFLVSNCQNWVTSQTLRDNSAGISPTPVTATQIVEAARRSGAAAVVSSYNEPLITAEWAIDVFKEARRHDLLCGFVSNGNATPTVLDALRPWAQLYKIDLKTMQDKHYRQLGAVLQHILDGIKMVYERGFWLEIVTLIVPGFNDSTAELAEAARFIASVSPDIPWHVTAFHADYQMTGPRNTTELDVLRAAEIGREQGLNYVYAGNLPGHVSEFENTYCPACRTLLVERRGYYIRGNHLTPSGACPGCGNTIPGIWTRG